MGASANRKPKTEANLQNDAVLGDLLGQIKTSAATKSDSKTGSGSALAAKPKLAPSTSSSNQKSHSNPFAVRPASTGLKKKCAPETDKTASNPSVKAEAIEDDDATALSQLIEDDDFRLGFCV